jgi:hypothetical protein
VPADAPKPLEPAAPDTPKQSTTTTPTQPAGDPGATIGTTSTASAAATATTTGPGACAAAAVKTSLTTVQQKSLCTHMPDSATPAACFQLIESKPVHGMKFTWDDMATLCQKPNSHDAPHACLEQQHTKDASLSAHKLVEICAGAPAVKSAAGRASRAHAAVISLALASVVALALGRAGVAA